MLTYINYYLITGFVWLVLNEIYLNRKLDNGIRFRLWVFWPVTVIAWIIGFVAAFVESFNNDEEL
jgi:hypothetical protein